MCWSSWIARAEGSDSREGYNKCKRFATELGIVNKSRKPDLVSLRWLFWEYALDEVPNLTLAAAAKITGHDHTTVINGMKQLRKFRSVKDRVLEVEERRFAQLRQSFERSQITE